MIIKGDLERMVEEFGHPGGGLKTMLDAMEAPSHARHLLLQLNTQRTKGFLCDVIIVVQNALFRAHKNILAASSLYLKSLVVHDNLINLDHEMVSPGVFRVILDYIYTGRLGEAEPGPGAGPEPSLAAVLAAASYLQLLDLVALCKKRLKRTGKYHPRPDLLPYEKMGPSREARFRSATPVIQACIPGGVAGSHPSRAAPGDPLATHVGELYAPATSQGSLAYSGPPSVLALPLGLRPPRPERGCSPDYGLDLSKKSPTPQAQQVAAHIPHSALRRDDARGGELSGHNSPSGINEDDYPTNGDPAFQIRLEPGDTTGDLRDLASPSYPHLSQPFGPHLPTLQRSLSRGSESYFCPTTLESWVKREPPVFGVEDEEEGDDEEEDSSGGAELRNRRKTVEDKLGVDDKSGTASEESGSSEGHPSPPGVLERFHPAYEPESFGDNLYVCIPCDKGFPSSEQLNAHVETHNEEDLSGEPASSNGSGGGGNINSNNGSGCLPYPEGKSCSSLPALGETMRPYRCSSCEKSYKDPATLRQHEKTHWLTRPYPCSICGKKFTQRGTMTRHMRSHLGLKPFACDACGMRFTRQYRLTEHMRIHSGEKPYECQVCGGKFAQQRNLISHMKMHGVGVGMGGAADGKLKVDFGDGLFPLGLKPEAMEGLFPLSKLAAQHLGLTHDKMDALGQTLSLQPQQLAPDLRTIDRYSPS
nr:hypermethylated in cancer 1 protein isoform X1 [Paramormyrops kingsleyae]